MPDGHRAAASSSVRIAQDGCGRRVRDIALVADKDSSEEPFFSSDERTLVTQPSVLPSSRSDDPPTQPLTDRHRAHSTEAGASPRETMAPAPSLSIAPDEPLRSPITERHEASPQSATQSAVISNEDLSPWERLKPRLWTAARYALLGFAGYMALILLVLIPLFRFVDPPGSALMLRRFVTGTAIDRRWVDLDQISPRLVRAVIVSEDGRFCDHSGIDLEAIEQAIRSSGDGAPRGASTISMQVIKNLFLWPDKSYIRKVIELPLTLVMEAMWPKWRVAEIYLNSAEWGPGIFGAEAAAQHHFHKSAARLTEQEAALLAASLPNPMIRDASDPGPQTARKARVIQSRVRAYGSVAQCVTSVQNAAPEPEEPKLRERRQLLKRPERPRPRREEPSGISGWTTEIQ